MEWWKYISDGSLATAERGAISIWKPIKNLGEKKFEFYKEIITEGDTCQLLEINPKIFACAIYENKLIKVYKKNDENDYLLFGEISDAESHGYNSNGMAKINENVFCSGGCYYHIYIVSVEPLQIIQKIILDEDSSRFDYVKFLHNSNDGFIFTYFDDKIIQYKIAYDENENFLKLEKFDEIDNADNCKAIATTDEGKIFYKKKTEDYKGKSIFILANYKTKRCNDFHLIK